MTKSKKVLVVGKGKFPCTGCGACCKRVWAIAPDMALPNGVCKNLQEDNSCGIYDTRPDFCRISLEVHLKDKFYYGDRFKTEKEFFEATAKICNKLILEDGLDKKYIPSLEGIEYETSEISDKSPEDNS